MAGQITNRTEGTRDAATGARPAGRPASGHAGAEQASIEQAGIDQGRAERSVAEARAPPRPMPRPGDAPAPRDRDGPPGERRNEARPAAGGRGGGPHRVPPPVPEARLRPRHRLVLLSFVLLVLLPVAATAWYLYDRAVDQYASIMAFSVRSEESRSALDVLGRLGTTFGAGAGAGARDAEILYQFIQSQEMVARIDAQLDLGELYGRHIDTDPVFAFDADGTIEDLTEHWARMLRIAFDTSTGLMEIRVLAFEPQEAQAIARAILAESTGRINELSAAARADATRYAREDLDVALERLRRAREALTEFRVRTQVVDPSADIQGQMGLLNTLQAQLADALIELDLLRETTREGDPRITQQQRRIEVIRARIAEERARIGGGTGPAGEDFATVMAEFERLSVDREFAEQAYRSAMSAYDAALADAQRATTYLATHVTPTLAESARYPEREKLLALVAFFLLLIWAVGVLVYYSVRDSR